jgi:hypothetical protein
MIERVEPAVVWPWVRGWVKTNLCRGGRVYFADKWKGSVQVGVPRYRTSGKERRRNEGCPRVDQRLEKSTISPSVIHARGYYRPEMRWEMPRWRTRTCPAGREHEQHNSETWQ